MTPPRSFSTGTPADFMRPSADFMRPSGGFMRPSGGFMRPKGADVLSKEGTCTHGAGDRRRGGAGDMTLTQTSSPVSRSVAAWH
jgi:hypothetical protein